ncbi:MAG: hypothetical protein ACRDTC_25220 [Pseudonocardiaceae bacterium]
MTRSSQRREPPAARPLSNVTIAVGAAVVLGIGVLVWIVLLRRYGGAGADVELDAIRTAGTLLIGTGGAAALLLAARRQRATELALLHTDRDATERRITELYTKAADQLGSDQAPVRLAGLYALERLANSTAEHRQTIVNVICAYLRMPYAPPPDRRPATAPTAARPCTDGAPERSPPACRHPRPHRPGISKLARSAKSGSPPKTSSPATCASPQPPADSGGSGNGLPNPHHSGPG